MADKEAALVLPPDAVASGELHTFAGFPGRWLPGDPVAVRALGLTQTEARSMIAELGLPLKEARVDALPETLFTDTAGLVSEATVASEAAPSLPRSTSRYPGLSAAEAQARDQEPDTIPAARAHELPPDVARVIADDPTVTFEAPPVPGDPAAAVNQQILTPSLTPPPVAPAPVDAPVSEG